MRRSILVPVMAWSFAASVLAGAASGGCGDLRIASTTEAGALASEDGGVPGDGDGGGPPGSGDAAGGTDGATGPLLYDDVQAALEKKRFPGPTTAQGSKGYCTPKYFVWRESDGTMHSWAGKTQARIDYAFKAQGTRPYFVPSDVFIATDIVPGYSGIDVHRTDTANTLAGSIPYSHNFVSAANGVIRLDQVIDNVDIGGTQVRRWNAGTLITEDITTVLPTREPPSSFENDVLVLPGSVTIPFPLYLVDVVKKTTSSVIFDGALVLQQTEQFAGGLAVAYVRSGTSGAALRVYKGDHDDASNRYELGDDLANRGPYFSDSPGPLEHKFLSRITTWNQKIIYGSAYGIWAYDLLTGALAPVQLVSGKKTAVPDVLCVLRQEGLLVYRMGDAVGQVWAVPLASVFQ